MPVLLKRILLALLLGMALNWLVAWALTEVPRRLHIGSYHRVQLLWPDGSGTPRNLYITEYRWVGVLETQYHEQRRAITQVRPSRISAWWAWSPLTAEPSAPDEFDRLRASLVGDDIDPNTSVYSVIEYGFPLISTRATGAINDAVVLADGSYARKLAGAFSGPIIAPARTTKVSTSPLALHVWFPYRPVWSGMLINTAFYALLAWCVLAVLRAVRHARRMHKGRCPMCRYDLGFDFRAGCPECGWRKAAIASGSTSTPS